MPKHGNLSVAEILWQSQNYPMAPPDAAFATASPHNHSSGPSLKDNKDSPKHALRWTRMYPDHDPRMQLVTDIWPLSGLTGYRTH